MATPRVQSAHPVEVSDEVVKLVRQILSAIARCHGKFGVGVVAELLCGSESERTLKWRLNELPTFGLLRAYSAKRMVAMLHRVLETGLARQRDPQGVRFRPVVEITTAGISVMKGEQYPPAALADLLPSHRESEAEKISPEERFGFRWPRPLYRRPAALRTPPRHSPAPRPGRRSARLRHLPRQNPQAPRPERPRRSGGPGRHQRHGPLQDQNVWPSLPRRDRRGLTHAMAR